MKRMTFWAELRWLIAVELLLIVERLTRKEASDRTLRAMQELSRNFDPDDAHQTEPTRTQ